jgi:phosphoribosylformimino-5-aminoimidazole carboxamide ribotide isomerase
VRENANAFELIPAIDLLDDRVVRLRQGRYDEVTVYDSDPPAVAARFAAAGITRLHVVDLEGARDGAPRQRETVRAIVEAATGIPVQLGGGVRDIAAVESALALGLERVILGTIALRDPALVREAAKRFPGHVAVGIDARDGRVAVEGWLDVSETTALDLAREFEDAGVAAIIHTDIARDGMGSGPNLDATAELASEISIPVVASGGVGSAKDVARVASRCDEGIAGVIVGRALYDGSLTIDAALAASRGEEAGCS